MTAEAVDPFDASPVPVLPPDTRPTAIRDALIDEERVEFERAYRQALAEAAETLDLTRVLDVLRTGRNADAVPIEDVKALISQWLGR